MSGRPQPSFALEERPPSPPSPAKTEAISREELREGAERPPPPPPAPEERPPSTPSPAETEAISREELQEVVEQQRRPPARMLAAFLRDPAQTRQITGKGDERTNIIDQGARVTYALAAGALDALFGHLEAMRRAGLKAHFSERQGTPAVPTSGLMLDYDLVVQGPEARLDERGAHRVVCRVVRALRADLLFPPEARRGKSDVALHVFVIQKPRPTPLEGGASKHGFHLLFPGVRVSRGYKKLLLRRLRGDAEIVNVLRGLGAVGSGEDCLDQNSASVPVLFLGSCKRGAVPYELGPIFEVTFDAAFAPPAASGGPPPPPPSGEFWPMIQKLQAAELEAAGYNLVAEASVGFEARYRAPPRAPLVPALECACQPALAAKVADLSRRACNGLVSEEELLLAEHSLSALAVHDPEVRYLHQVLDLLDESYYTERGKWRDVVFALANTSDAYKPLAEWFSQKCPSKWASGGRAALDALWDDALARRGSVSHPLTQRSIVRWAQDCNPERFRQVSEQSYFTVLAKYVYAYGGVLEHFMVARVLHAMLGNKFVVDIAEGHHGRFTYCWFEFVVPGQPARPGEVWKWRKEVEPDEIHRYLSEGLVKVFDHVAQHLDERRAEAESEDQAKQHQGLARAFLGSRRKIFNDTFKNGVIRQANYLFRRRGFAEALDQDPSLLGTGNGVLRLGAPCALIDHFHEHPVMRFTPAFYRRFDPADPWVRLILAAVADIIPEPDVRDWILFYAASSLAGGTKEGLLLLWYGGGANGKTFFMRMVAKALGPHYAKKLNIALLTSEREAADRPNSAVMQLKGCRFGYFEETQKSEPLNSQRLKEIVNPGEISGRDLNARQECFEVTANVMVGHNYDFVIDTTDHGTWRRLRHYCSKVKFCPHPDPANSFEKKEDQRFAREYVHDPNCQAAMLSILAHYYERLLAEFGGAVKNVPSPTLDRETEAFRTGQDTIHRFITQMIVRSPASGFRFPLSVAADRYVLWYAANIDSRHRQVPSETIQDLENSALRPFIRREANRQLSVYDCRLLSADGGDDELRPGESYLGVAPDRPSRTPPPPSSPASKRRSDWRGAPAPPPGGPTGAAVGGRPPPADWLLTDESKIPEPPLFGGPPPPAEKRPEEEEGLSEKELEDLLFPPPASPPQRRSRSGFTIADILGEEVGAPAGADPAAAGGSPPPPR